MTEQTANLVRESTGDNERQRLDDRFVPIRACDLITTLANDGQHFGLASDAFHGVADAILDVIEQETAAFERELADLYAAFNPDRDTQSPDRKPSPQDCADLTRCLAYLLEKTNFEHLSDVQIEAAVHAANSRGLRVRLHPERVDYLAIWVRGRGTDERDRRTLRHPVRGETRTIDIFRRIAVLARLRDDPHIIIKLFKDIPIEDVEALLPHAEIEMTLRDRALLIGGSAGTLGSTAGKVFGLLKGMAALTSLLWVVLIGAAMLTYRTFMGYRRARSNRDSQRTRHLYYQNLGNNGAALHTLTSMIAQEELKEAVLAYAFCHQSSDQSWTPRELADRVAEYFAQRFALGIDFDASDAIETLTRLNLWRDTVALRVVPCDEALRRLRNHYADRRSTDYHMSMARR